MQPSNSPDNPLSNLQFTTNEPASPTSNSSGLTCVGCKRSIDATYFALADQVICPSCRDQVTAKPTGNGLVRFFKAVAFGAVAGLLGALIWYLIRVIAHVEIGLIAILVGFMVGKAIHTATGGKGGLKYQFLAVALTYSCIAVNYVPDIVQALMSELEKPGDTSDVNADNIKPNVELPNDLPDDKAEPLPVAASEADTAVAKTDTPVSEAKERLSGGKLAGAFVMLGVFTMVFALATPILAGFESPIGLLIMAFALWEAWKFSGHKPLPITGPYQVGQSGPPTVQSV